MEHCALLYIYTKFIMSIKPQDNLAAALPQVAYLPKVWSSVPRSVWVPNINWIVFCLVLGVQIVITVAIFLTRVKTLEGATSSCRQE